MQQTGLGDRRKRLRDRLFLLSTYAISFACLWWVLRDQNWNEFAQDLGDIKDRWYWIPVAAFADILVYVWQGWRWSLLLQPVEKIPILRSVRAIYVGLFANEVLPLKTGELIRCYLQARWSSIPFSVTLSSALIERIFDGFFLGASLFVVSRFVPNLPSFITRLGMVVGIFVIVAAVLVALAMFHKQRVHAALTNESGWHRHLRILLEDLHLIGHSRYLYGSALVTIPHMAMQAVPTYFMLRAYDFPDASWGMAAILTIILRLAASVPQAPGNLGVFNYLVVVVLAQVFHQDQGLAKRFSVFLWMVITMPLLVAGFFSLAITGAHLGELSRKAQSAMPSRKPDPVPADPQ